jgi:hypothetical protein
MSLDVLLCHESEKRVVLKRHVRTGKVLSAHFMGCDERYCYDTHPFRTPRSGTKYARTEVYGDRKVWEHKALPYRAMNMATEYLETRQAIDRYIRALFAGVAQSCLVSS